VKQSCRLQCSVQCSAVSSPAHVRQVEGEVLYAVLEGANKLQYTRTCRLVPWGDNLGILLVPRSITVRFSLNRPSG
jgi:hypothetical protein